MAQRNKRRKKRRQKALRKAQLKRRKSVKKKTVKRSTPLILARKTIAKKKTKPKETPKPSKRASISSIGISVLSSALIYSKQFSTQILNKGKKYTKQISIRKKPDVKRVKPFLTSTKLLLFKAINPKTYTSWVTKRKWFLTRFKTYKYMFGGFVILFGLLYFFILRDLPTPTTLTQYEQTPLATRLYDRNGEILYEIFAEENRTLVSLGTIPDHMQQATVAIEDKDFYKHHGVNPVGGILRAVKDSITKGQLQGGSTITQQLIKNTLLTPERTVERKVKEGILAVWTDLIYSKEQILELYLNTVPYGGTAWGVDAAAKKYFGKDVDDLTLSESALLAGLPQAPTRFSPFGPNPELAITRQHTVLNRMVEDGYISQEEADKAKDEELEFVEQTRNIKAAHFVMYVKDKLVEEYGQKLVEQGGLQVTTSLDYEIQEAAEQTVLEEIEDLEGYNVSNGATLVTRPSTGEILAMVGSVDYFKEGWGSVNVTTRLRQPGSSIKPINYAIGIENREVTASSVFNDDKKCYPGFSGPAYCPKNYDGTFHGPVQTRFALASSYNIPAVKMLELNTVETMVASASAFGIDTFEESSDYGLSLTLGGGEVRMTDMAEAFGVFANEGKRKDLISILEVKDRDGKVLQKYEDPNLEENVREPLKHPSSLLLSGDQVLSPETTYIISHILLDNGARSPAFGSNSLLRVKDHAAVSVKTGTTDDLRDNWTIGYTPNFLVATWVGNNDNTQMSRVASGVTGATPIWNSIMQFVLENQEDLWPREPSGITGRTVCAVSGMQPREEDPCPSTRYEYYIEGSEPNYEQIFKQNIPVWKDTGRPATQKEKEDNPDNIEDREHTIMHDVVGDIVCLDCPPPTPPESQGG